MNDDCPKVKIEETDLCVWTAENAVKCGPVAKNIADLCSAAADTKANCEAVKSGDTVLC